jgi:hypothetical protein
MISAKTGCMGQGMSYNRLREPEPDYTHALHATACHEAAMRQEVLVRHLLVKRGPVVYCAVLKGAYTVPGGPDCWTVETVWPEKARITVPCRNTIACNPEFCSCTAAALSGHAQRGPLSASGASAVLEVTCL